ncbi:MAG: hypothetical protein DRQ48_00110 [Gammaproteobacteria bacterium]|nr:MAG: hypothetical protein DRQ48_00110 [Gammaproteobacteria bacterium]
MDDFCAAPHAVEVVGQQEGLGFLERDVVGVEPVSGVVAAVIFPLVVKSDLGDGLVIADVSFFAGDFMSGPDLFLTVLGGGLAFGAVVCAW